MAKGLFDCTGKVTLVTGGNGGIGLGFAMGVAKMGGDIAIWARNADKNEAAAAALREAGAGRAAQGDGRAVGCRRAGDLDAQPQLHGSVDGVHVVGFGGGGEGHFGAGCGGRCAVGAHLLFHRRRFRRQ